MTAGDIANRKSSDMARELGRSREYLVRVTWPVHKVYTIEARSRKEAVANMKQTIDAGDVSVWSDGFEADEVDPTIEVEGLA